MEKKFKKVVIDLFTRRLHEALPSFAPLKEKSEYLLPAEKAWQDSSTVAGANSYIIFTPDFKGRDQFTIELGWSTLRRFPELLRRPSLSFAHDFENCYARPEASARLPKIISLDTDSWISINPENVEETIAQQIRDIIDFGIPFLKKLESA